MAILTTVCAEQSCGRPGCVSFEGHDLCRAHFISGCYQRLEEYGRQLGQNEHWQMTSSEPLIDTLAEMIDQATTLGLTSIDLDGLQQAQLLDILFTAGNMMKNLRRSIRRYISIPLKLRYEVTGHNWTEESNTLEVSLHGACIECRIPIAKGEIMTVERVDNHRSARAKVRWHRRKPDGTQTLGIELLDSGDFWEFDKA
jgi:hypothetical protein